MSLDRAIEAAITYIPECLAAGYVDMSTGTLLSVKTVDSHPSEALDLVAAATGDLFQGTNVVAIESILKKQRGIENGHHYFQELFIMSDNLLHVFLRSKRNPDHAVVYICHKDVNIGMVIAKSRISLAKVEAAL